MSLFVLLVEFNEISARTFREGLWINSKLIVEIRLFLRVINIYEIRSMVNV
jgi:hypothetical protein